MVLTSEFFSVLPVSIKYDVSKNFITFKGDAEKKAYILGKRVQLTEFNKKIEGNFVEISKEEAKQKHLGKIRCIGNISDEKELLKLFSIFFDFVVPNICLKQPEVVNTEKKEYKTINNEDFWCILLVRQGYENFVYKQINSNKKTLKFIEITLLNDAYGYVFIRTSENSLIWSKKFLQFEGVIKFIGSKKSGPQKFTQEDIKKLDTSEVELKPQKKSNFKKGDYVIIKQGDLSDIEGEIIEIANKNVKIKPLFFPRIVQTTISDIEMI